MSLFRFCRQGLTALSVFFVFMACDKLLPTSDSGELVPVKIRSVSVKGYGEASATRSAGGEKRIVGQPIIQDLGGGLFAEISVEEDVSALRDAQRLDNGAKFRIIALNEGTNTIYSWADYTAASSGTLEPVAGNLHVVSGVKYDFVCFSYNDPSTATYWPNPLNEGDALGVLTVDNTRDFLYKKLTTSLSAASNTLDLTLEQQLTKVTLILDAGSRSITNVANNSIKISSVSTPTTFNLAATTNALSGTAASDVSFTSWESTSASIWQDALRLLPTGSVPTLSLPEEAITVNNTWKSEAKDVTLPALAVGSSYTIRLTLVKLPKFAGSNIYWGGESIGLTFKPYNESNTTPNPETYYQGVFFKWGSLIGISPARTSSSTVFSSGTTDNEGKNDGTPIYMKDSDGNWVKTNVAYAISQNWISGGGQGAIPSYYDTDITESALVGMDKHTLLANPDFEHYKGDICNYINKDYRMPTGNELKDIIPYPYASYASDAVIVDADENNQAGRYTFAANKCATLKEDRIFPASGYRENNAGTLSIVGDNGYYWSGSAYSGTYDAYFLGFYSSGHTYTNSIYRNFGFPVRCVLQE